MSLHQAVALATRAWPAARTPARLVGGLATPPLLLAAQAAQPRPASPQQGPAALPMSLGYPTRWSCARLPDASLASHVHRRAFVRASVPRTIPQDHRKSVRPHVKVRVRSLEITDSG